MAFQIPRGYDRFANEVFSRFRILLSRHVFNGITQLTLRDWQSNFVSDEEQYLAAHLLDALMFRTDPMIDSTSQHVIEMVLPKILMENSLYGSPTIDDFMESLAHGDLNLGLRFVAVDGSFEATPGKSGAQLIRQFSRSTGVNKNLLLRPENIVSLGNDAKALIFIDDCVGTGRQFDKFCKAYNLVGLKESYKLIYIPFVAHYVGLKFLNKKYPFLCIAPVEELGLASNFFNRSVSDQNIWMRDNSNTVADVKNFYSSLMASRGVRPESKYCLNLSLGFSFSTPNNTLKAYFSNQGSWQRLLVR